MQMPPGSAMPSSRAATLTPSPKMSSPSIMISPILIPIRVLHLRADCARCLLRHFPLNCNCARHGIDGACELDQHAVAGRLDDPALVRGDGGINEFASDHLEGG